MAKQLHKSFGRIIRETVLFNDEQARDKRSHKQVEITLLETVSGELKCSVAKILRAFSYA